MDSPEEEINLYFKIVKTIAMRVKRSETIKNLKVMLHEKEGISEDVQDLFFDGDHLRDDGQRISDYGIPRNSTINLVCRDSSRMKLCFKMPSNEKTIVLNVQKSDTIQKIKSIIQDREHICSYDFDIYSSGRLLENHRTVASLNVQSNNTLQLISNRKETILVSVETPTEGVIEVEVRWMHTVLDVKKIIESMINIPIQCMELFIGRTEEQLEDGKSFASYDMDQLDFLTIKIPDKFQISVTDLIGKTVTLEVFHSSTVRNVKELLYRLMGVQVYQQRIIFKGRQLEDRMTLGSYSIGKESSLYMVLRLGGPPETWEF
ncbi:hypothetical protein ACOSP7_006699 [Xanthoceras sorbifolium]